MSNINDVCQLAGVSKATVSRVLNGTGQVKQSTKELVYAAMKQLDYHPNSIARALATNQTNTIGLVLADFESDYFANLMQQAARTAETAGKQLIISGGHNNADKEYHEVRMLSDRCDAIVLYTRLMPESMLLQLKQELSIPLVLFNREFANPKFPSVIFSEKDSVIKMTKYFIDYGHRNIACIAGHLKQGRSQSRLDSFKLALQQNQLELNPELVASGNYTIESGYQACQTLLDKNIPFSALFAFNDLMAFGALKALQQRGIRVPEHISLCGIDNTAMAEFTSPALTTFDQPVKKMADYAIRLAIELAQNKDLDNQQQHYFEGQLIQRHSVAPLYKK